MKKQKVSCICFFIVGKLKISGKKLKTWLERKANINLPIELKNILFSSSAHVIVSYLITIAKYYIYKSKFNTKNINIKGFDKTGLSPPVFLY